MMTIENAASDVIAGQRPRVLVCGASFAGLTTAYWMNRQGCDVTVVEVSGGLKMGGTPVNIEGETVEIARRMGLLERIVASSLPARPVQFVDADGVVIGVMSHEGEAPEERAPEYEIERDELLQMQFDAVKDDVAFMFGDTIARMEEREDAMQVTFRSGAQREFALGFGCDGNHSAVRRMWFGEESAYSTFLQAYFSITIVDRLLLKEDTTQIFSVAGKCIMLNGYHGKTDICFGYFAEEEIAYDYRDTAEQRRMIAEEFADVEWRAKELLDEVAKSSSFYFDKLCQVKMPSWTKGRVALVGDSAYCASPVAGLGGSLAIIGATALGDAMQKHPDDYETAFRAYNEGLRPYIEQVQAHAVEFGLKTFAPRTEEELAERNARFSVVG